MTNNKFTEQICLECGASDSCKKVDDKTYRKIKKQFGLVGYNPKKMTNNIDNLVRDICSVSVAPASKSKVRSLVTKALTSHTLAIRKEVKNIKSKKFPRGERMWCIECAQRIEKEILALDILK